ncbi:hypothetical protein GCM10015535_19740 [Streptomyces gelaticus]|uniref:DUF4276 family protein n=1 Tax=Streptomyces gelaticus TaxID=285446 RepID=A0ABQ2VVF4_9ACTN|nr:hypothetical protein [Streptomyces gelaticus]GGV80863.1 hypothetical protein GCM10015535_19740 [Streptomyces gelaticus]
MLAGESANDRRILATFIKAAHPDLAATVTLTEITDPVRLRKKSGAELATAAGTLVSKARGKACLKSGEFVGIAVHEDMDACPGPAYDIARKAVSAALAKATGASSSVYALAAAESEAWLLLFPEAFTLYRSSWKIPATWQGKDSGRRQNPKEDLENLLASPRFRESDGPEIASAAFTKGLLAEPKGSNRSYQEFVTDICGWKIPHLPSR